MSEKRDTRARELLEFRYGELTRRIDHMFAWLMLVQWAGAVVVAIWISPLTWAGRQSSVHAHVYAAIFLGGLITILPVTLAWRQPSKPTTRYVIASAQVLWSALLVHLTGGRIETHFHFFASLAIIAFYRDIRTLIPATVVVTLDHFIRGIYWPESVYGVVNPEWWRFLEHAGWIVFLDVFLVWNCIKSYDELRLMCVAQADVEEAEQAMARVEKLAAVGQLAASVGHELRNPLAAIKNAHALVRRMTIGDQADPKLTRFLDIMQREIAASQRIIDDLLDFARERPLERTPCPLHPLVQEVFEVVPSNQQVELANHVAPDLDVPDLDKGQIRQVLINVVQNAVEAFEGNPGRVEVSADHDSCTGWSLRIRDTGPGMTAEVLEQLFEPLFSTKVKGTGLGLAVVASMVKRHGGSIRVESTPGEGTSFLITLPPTTQAA